MQQKYTTNLEAIATYGFELIDPNESVEVNLKDLMYVYTTLSEYMRFFHQPLHYQSLADVENFLGSVNDNAGFKLLHQSIHQKMCNMLPKHINDKFGDGDFDSPDLPFYYDSER